MRNNKFNVTIFSNSSVYFENIVVRNEHFKMLRKCLYDRNQENLPMADLAIIASKAVIIIKSFQNFVLIKN